MIKKKIQVSSQIGRKEKRAIKRLKHSTLYKYAIGLFICLFTPAKKFIFLPVTISRKAFGIISLSIYKIFGYKVGYIDDFIIHKKLRGKGVGKELFNASNKEAEKEKCDYLILFSRKNRKSSHRFYKKAGLIIIGLGIGIFAYKKIKNKK